MPITSLAVIIGGVCAAVTLIAALARALFKAVAEAQTNTRNLAELDDRTTEQDKQLGDHETRITVLEDRGKRDGGPDGS